MVKGGGRIMGGSKFKFQCGQKTGKKNIYLSKENVFFFYG